MLNFEKIGPRSKLVKEPFISIECSVFNLEYLVSKRIMKGETDPISKQLYLKISIHKQVYVNTPIDNIRSFISPKVDIPVIDDSDVVEIEISNKYIVGKQFIPISFLEKKRYYSSNKFLNLKLIHEKNALDYLTKKAFELFYFNPEEFAIPEEIIDETGCLLNRISFHRAQLYLHKLPIPLEIHRVLWENWARDGLSKQHHSMVCLA